MPEYAPGSTDYVTSDIEFDGQPAANIPSTIEFAFVPDGLELDPDTVTWHTAVPEDDHTAHVRIGPYQNGIVLAAGSYDMYVRLTADPIRPILRAGPVTIH